MLSGDPVEEVGRLKDQSDELIQIPGSAQLVQTLLAADLIDELRLMVFPVLLGDGKRVFGELPDQKRFQLSDSRTVGEGIAILTLTAT